MEKLHRPTSKTFLKIASEGMHTAVGFKFFVSRFYYRSYILSASSVSTSDTSRPISSNANRFAVLIKTG